MNPAHVHIALNHVPVVGIGFALLTLAIALFKNDEGLRRLGLVFLVLIAAATVPVRLTGEGAEAKVEHLAGVSESLIGRHERAANVASASVAVLGIAALVGLGVWRRRAAPRWFRSGVLALTLLSTGLLAWTANLGGQVRHTEIRAASLTGGADEAVQKTPMEKDE